MTVSTKNFATLVSDMAAAVQGWAATLIDLTVGSILLAVIEACAASALWLQSLVLAVLAVTRAATSTGADLDSFVGDYGLTRDPPVGARGPVTFARFTDTSTALIFVGTPVQTLDGTQTFTVIADPTNPAWNGSTGFTLPGGTRTLTVAVQASTLGVASNVTAGTIGLILTAIPFVDTVTNASAMTGGADAETDAALRVRFRLWIAGLSSGTPVAIEAAVAGVQPGLVYAVNPNVNPDGSTHLGFVTVIVDDGSGAPSMTLLGLVTAAVSLVVAAGITFGVFGPTVVTANIAASVTVAAGYVGSTVRAEVAAAIIAYVKSLGFGQTLAFNRLYQVIYDASPGVTGITALTVNSGTSDLTATGSEAVRPGTTVVT